MTTNDLPAEARLMRAVGFSILRHGDMATVEDLAEVAGLDAARVQVVLAAMVGRGAAQLNEHGAVVGIGGLSLTSTPHKLILDGVPLHTWCAFDALGIPPALGIDAIARSRCAMCDEVVEVTFRAGRATDSARVVTWFPDVAAVNVRRDFCAIANLFCSREHLDAWRLAAGGPPGDALTLTEVADRGRADWALEACG